MAVVFKQAPSQQFQYQDKPTTSSAIAVNRTVCSTIG